MAYDIVGGYLEDVRTLLQDRIQPYRYSTKSLIRAMNATMLEARRLRPDLFFDNLDNVPQYFWEDAEDTQSGTDNDDDDNPTWQEWVPMEQSFRQAFVHGITAHALARDQEDIQDERSTGFMKTFVNMMTGIDPTKGKVPPRI
jgi:hypothetical protein